MEWGKGSENIQILSSLSFSLSSLFRFSSNFGYCSIDYIVSYIRKWYMILYDALIWSSLHGLLIVGAKSIQVWGLFSFGCFRYILAKPLFDCLWKLMKLDNWNFSFSKLKNFKKHIMKQVNKKKKEKEMMKGSFKKMKLSMSPYYILLDACLFWNTTDSLSFLWSSIWTQFSNGKMTSCR